MPQLQIGISARRSRGLWDILIALLCLGNVSFGGDDGALTEVAGKSLETMGQALYLLPIVLPTTHLLPPTIYCSLPTTYRSLPTTYYLLLSAYHLLPTAHCLPSRRSAAYSAVRSRV